MFERNDIRGFTGYSFRDRYGAKCSVQESSLATEAAIWLGVDDVEPKVMARDAASVGVATKETCGWVPYPIPKVVRLSSRMHLTQEQVAALLPVLQHFAETGALPTAPAGDAAADYFWRTSDTRSALSSPPAREGEGVLDESAQPIKQPSSDEVPRA